MDNDMDDMNDTTTSRIYMKRVTIISDLPSELILILPTIPSPLTPQYISYGTPLPPIEYDPTQDHLTATTRPQFGTLTLPMTSIPLPQLKCTPSQIYRYIAYHLLTNPLLNDIMPIYPLSSSPQLLINPRITMNHRLITPWILALCHCFNDDNTNNNNNKKKPEWNRGVRAALMTTLRDRPGFLVEALKVWVKPEYHSLL
jgi:hypothetical protein